MEEDDVFIDEQSRKFLATFNNIQDLSLRYGLRLDIPSIVVVGGQSSGKSSLVEALMGFIFNFTQGGIATRCPLILQMENDSRKIEPEFEISDPRLLQFMKNKSKFYYTAEVKYALEQYNKSLGDKIEQDPLTVKVKYQHCANLTIGDTPGFRLLGSIELINAAQNFILKLLSKDTIVVCVENATQDPSNYSALHFLFTHFNNLDTIVLVLNQFDKQVSSFGELSKVDIENRMSIPMSLGKVAELQRFYTAMPESRVKENWDPTKFRKEIQKICDLHRFTLKAKSVDQEVINTVGFDQLRGYLQKEIQKKYQTAIPNLVTRLQNLQNQTDSKLTELKLQQKQANLSSVRQILEKFTTVFARNYLEVMEGVAYEVTTPYRQTLEQEYVDFYKSNPDAPKFNYIEGLRQYVSNSQESIHGGSQYLRLLDEFQMALRSIELGKLDRDKLVNLRGRQEYQDANWLMVASKYMKEVDFKFGNDVKTFIVRLRYLLMRMFPTAVEITFLDTEFVRSFFNRYGFFLENLQKNFTYFIDKAMKKLEKQINLYIVATTNSIQLNTQNSYEDNSECIPNPTEEQIIERVKKEMGIDQTGETEPRWYYDLEWFSKQLTPQVYKKLEMICALHFKAVRDHISNYVELIVNGFFVRPIFKELGKFLSGEVEKSSQKQLGFAEIEQEANRIKNEIELHERKLKEIEANVNEALKLREMLN